MRLKFYVDVYPWSQPSTVVAWPDGAYVPAKSENAKRYVVTCVVPDPAEPDGTATETWAEPIGASKKEDAGT